MTDPRGDGVPRSLHQFTLLLKEVRLIEKKKNGLMPSAISVATDTASVRLRLRPVHVRSHALLSRRFARARD